MERHLHQQQVGGGVRPRSLGGGGHEGGGGGGVGGIGEGGHEGEQQQMSLYWQHRVHEVVWNKGERAGEGKRVNPEYLRKNQCQCLC
jgi:hypothetical protein